MDDSPDRQVYAEQAVRAAELMVVHLPANDPLRACLVAGVDPADSAWGMVIDQLGDGRTVIRHPPTGPTIRYGPLERLYRVPWDDPPRVVVASSATPRRRRGTTRPACTSKGRVSPR